MQSREEQKVKEPTPKPTTKLVEIIEQYISTLVFSSFEKEQKRIQKGTPQEM